MSYRGLETLKIGHTRTHTHTSGRQLNITFLDVLDYSEYSDTKSRNFFFHENIASSIRKQKYGNEVMREKKALPMFPNFFLQMYYENSI